MSAKRDPLEKLALTVLTVFVAGFLAVVLLGVIALAQLVL